MKSLGPYRLLQRIGKGGVGEVWAAEVGALGTAAAVKVLPPRQGADNDDFLRSFENEVEAAASLDHPNIVAVYDFGYGTEETKETTDGLVVPGAAWLVMERVQGRSLYGYRARLTWRQFRRILLDILDGLSHAHARNVIHRDIKPSNVLVTPDGMTTKLTDFGLAASMHRSPHLLRHMLRATGTPSYMSTEQITGEWHRQGPWTDLYGLGCLVYTMVNGEPMFRNVEPRDAMRRHLAGELPALQPKIKLPELFTDWVRTLLAPDPTERPRTAADAAALLDMVDPPVAERLPPPRPPMMPSDWRRTVPTSRTARSTPNPALHRLRRLPMVGRITERDALWAQLRAARESRSLHVMVTHSAPGMGRTRLMEWLAERTAEVGAARVFAHKATDQDVTAAVSSIFRQGLSTDGVPQESLRSHLVERMMPAVMQAHVIDGLMDILDSERAEPDAAALFAEVITRLSWDRPILLILDDVHSCPVLCDLVVRLATHTDGKKTPILVVASIDRVEGGASLSARWDALAHEHVHLGPMTREEGFTFLREALDLDPEVASKLSHEFAGNPLAVSDLVFEWIENGTLVAGTDGARLANANTSLRLPDGVVNQWQTRTIQVLEQLPEAQVNALQLGAIMGTEVDLDRWTKACSVLDLDPHLDAVRALVRARLAATEGQHGVVVRWRFAQMMARRTLLEAARNNRWRVLNGAIAVTLPQKSPTAAKHWVEAGHPKRALDALQSGLRRAESRGLVNEAEQHLQLIERALAEMGAKPSDPRWLDHWLARSKLAERRGLWTDAERFAQRAIEIAPPDTEVRMDALRHLGRVERVRGMFTEALSRFEEVIDWASAHDRTRLEAAARRDRGYLLIRWGRLDQAADEIEAAIALFESMEDQLGVAGTLGMLGLIKKQRGNFTDARSLIERATILAEPSPNLLAACKNNLADLERLLGHTDAAWRLLQEASRINRANESPRDLVNELNLGLVLLAKGRAQDARERIERALRYNRDDLTHQVGRAGLALSAARLHDWDRVSDHLDVVEELDQRCFRVDIDLAMLLEEAGRAALRKQQRALAYRSLTLSRRQWQGLGRDRDVERVNALVPGGYVPAEAPPQAH